MVQVRQEHVEGFVDDVFDVGVAGLGFGDLEFPELAFTQELEVCHVVMFEGTALSVDDFEDEVSLDFFGGLCHFADHDVGSVPHAGDNESVTFRVAAGTFECVACSWRFWLD